VSESSPLITSKPSPQASKSWLTRSGVPPASFMATMFGQVRASRAVVSIPISIPQRPGMLYKIIGSRVLSAIFAKWR
jgi:hypothetical protein